MPSSSQPAVRIANEFLVESNLADGSGSPSVAGLSDGSFLITWTGLLNGSTDGEDSNGGDIIGRAFLAGGFPLAPDFRVNMEIRDTQVSPVVSGSGSNYIVAYSSGEENALYGTFAASQYVWIDGGVNVPEQFGNYTMYNYAPAVDFLTNSTFVLTTTQEFDFEARVRSYEGQISSFRFGAVGSGPYISSVVATASDRFELIWRGYATEEQLGMGDAYGIYAQAATISGVAGAAVLISTDPTISIAADRLTDGNIVVGGLILNPVTQQIVGGSAHGGAVAALDDGGFVIVSTGSDGDGTGIIGQLYNGDGSARGASFVVNENIVGNQSSPSVAAVGGDDFVVSWVSGGGIDATVFSADAVPVDTALLVSTTVAGRQLDASATRLENGNLVTVWTDVSQIGNENRTDIRGQIIDPLGHKVGGEFLVNTTQIGEDSQPAVTATPDGGFSVAWSHGEEDLVPPPAPYTQHFAADGTKVGGELTFPAAFTGELRIASIGGGRTVVTYQDVDSETGIYGIVFKANGGQVGTFGIDDRYAHTTYDIAGLREGGFVLTYAAPEEALDGPRLVHVATYSSNGVLLSDRLAGDAANTDQSGPQIAALTDGGYIVSWSDEGAVVAQVYDVDGAKTGQAFEVSKSGAFDVAALADGRFVVSWATGGGGASTIHSQVFTTEGGRSGAEQVHVIDAGTFQFLNVGVSAIGDHGYAVTYNNTGGSSDGSAEAIRALLYTADNLVQGSNAGETVSGTTGGDTVHAGLGNDIVNAGGGNDLVYGEGGADIVHGGDGQDLIYGGFQNDSLYGDAGRDTIVGDIATIPDGSRASHDLIDGGADDDLLYGDAYLIAAGGTGGRDTIYGGAGADHIWGDAVTLEAGATGGNDIIYGGAGSDVIYGDAEFGAGSVGGNDRIEGGEGADDLWGGGGNDLFVYTSRDFGRDTIHDFGQSPGDRDVIDLRGLGLTLADLQINTIDGGTSIGAPFMSEGVITLIGVTSVSAEDFLF